MSFILLGILNSQVTGGFALADSYEHIETAESTANTSSVTFASIPQTYKHLQIRHSFKSGQSGLAIPFRLTVNNLTTFIYDAHAVFTNGAGASYDINTGSNYLRVGYASGASAGGATPAAGIIDIYDYTSTNKFKTVTNLGGGAYSGGREVALIGGIIGTSSAITRIDFSTTSPGEFLFTNTGGTSRISLYGIKG